MRALQNLQNRRNVHGEWPNRAIVNSEKKNQAQQNAAASRLCHNHNGHMEESEQRNPVTTRLRELVTMPVRDKIRSLRTPLGVPTPRQKKTPAEKMRVCNLR